MTSNQNFHKPGSPKPPTKPVSSNVSKTPTTPKPALKSIAPPPVPIPAPTPGFTNTRKHAAALLAAQVWDLADRIVVALPREDSEPRRKLFRLCCQLHGAVKQYREAVGDLTK